MITDPAEREAQRKELEGGFLRQEDYSRKMNEFAETRKAHEQAYATGQKWVEDSRAYYKEAVARAKSAEERLAILEKERTTPAAQPMEEINVADDAILAKALREAREDARQARAEAGELAKTVSRIDSMLSSGQLMTAEQIQAEAAKQFEAYGEAVIQTIETVQRANGEYGKPIDRKVLLAEAAKLGGDLNRAYDVVTADFKLEKIKSDIRKEVEDEYKAKMAAAGTPLATGAPPVEMGPLQNMVFQRQNPTSTIDAAIPADGSGRLAHAIAAELRSEGKY